MTTTTTAPGAANTITFDDIGKRVAELGKQAGEGNDTQIKFLLQLADGAHQGVLDLAKDKHGADRDDAAALTEMYVRSRAGAALFDRKQPSTKVAISKNRTAIRIGQWPKGGPGEPLNMLNNAMSKWRKLRANAATSSGLDDAASAFLKIARTQLKRDQLLDPAEYEPLLMKPVPDAKAAEDIIENARDALQKLYTGKAVHGTVKDNSLEIKASVDSLTARLKAIATAKGGKVTTPVAASSTV